MLSSLSGNLPIMVRAAFIPDTQIPLVFHFDRNAKRLTVSNEHHLTAPAQFLLPDRGDTTSGLLNAIGVLSLINAANPGELKDRRQRRHVLPPLDKAQKVRAEIGAFGERFLTQAGLLAEAADGVPELLPFFAAR